jgi:hypothetical protein
MPIRSGWRESWPWRGSHPRPYSARSDEHAAFNAGLIFTNYQATPNATAGQITTIVGNARQTQFSLKKLLW